VNCVLHDPFELRFLQCVQASAGRLLSENKKSPATHEGRPGVSEAKEVSVEKVTMWKSQRGLLCDDETSAAADDALQAVQKAGANLSVSVRPERGNADFATLFAARQTLVDAEEALVQLRRCIDRDATRRA
jgi:hypothetical protein